MHKELARGPSERSDSRAGRVAGPVVAPGKVTRTSRLPAGQRPAIQRSAAGATGHTQGARSAWEHTTDTWMDAAHRGAAAFPGQVQMQREDARSCPSCGGPASGGECIGCGKGGAQPVVQRQAMPQPRCRETSRRSGPEHELIQSYYKSAVDPTGAREYAIPAGSSAASGNMGYADLVSLGTHAMYEIKSYSPAAITAGTAQVNGYLQAARLNCDPDAPWHLGRAFPDAVIPFGNRELVARQYGHAGLILYYTRQKERRRVPEREIGWDRVLDVLLMLGLSITLVAVVVAALLDPEPVSKLALAGLSASMITAILAAFGMEEDASDVPIDA